MLSIRNVSFHFADRTIINHLSLEVDRGSFVSFLGPSGCGKTTLLRIIAGFLEPTGGTVALDCRLLSAPGNVVAPERRGMGMVFQNYAVWPHMSVYGNISYGLRLRYRSAAEQRVRTQAALELVNLQGLQDRAPSELSGGQQQRVAIARSIATEPSLLLLDEPLSNLDIGLRRDLLFDLKRIQERSGITFIYVTHDQSEALSVSDKLVVLEHGCIRQSGSPQEVYNRPSDVFVAEFVGSANRLAAVSISTAEGFTRFSLGEGAEIRLPVALAPGTTCEIAVKRRGLRFRPIDEGAHDPSCSGIITRTFFGGDHDEIAASVGGQEIYGFAEAERLRVGARVAVEFESASCHVFAK